MIQTIVSEFNSLGDGRYFDTASQSSFAFDHTTQVSDSSLIGRMHTDDHRKHLLSNHMCWNHSIQTSCNEFSTPIKTGPTDM